MPQCNPRYHTSYTSSSSMAISAAEGTTQNDLDQLESEFLELLNTARDPRDSNAITSDRLAKKLGIDGLPDRQEALKLLEDEILAPVRDLSGPGLSQWQTSVPWSTRCMKADEQTITHYPPLTSITTHTAPSNTYCSASITRYRRNILSLEGSYSTQTTCSSSTLVINY
jgi:hypothetical protein